MGMSWSCSAHHQVADGFLMGELGIKCESGKNHGRRVNPLRRGACDQFVHLLEMMFEEDQSSVNSGLC